LDDLFPGIEITFENHKPKLELIKWAYEAQAIQQPETSGPSEGHNLVVGRSVLAPAP
jgi:hypothetical protein